MEDKVQIKVNADDYCKAFHELQDCDQKMGDLRREAQEVHSHGTDALKQLVLIREQFGQLSDERNRHIFESQKALHEMRCSSTGYLQNTYSKPKKNINSETTKIR